MKPSNVTLLRAFWAEKLIRKNIDLNNSSGLRRADLPLTHLPTNALDALKSQTVDGQTPRT